MRKLKIAILTEIVNFRSGSRAPLEIARHLSLLKNDVTVYAFSAMQDTQAVKSLQKDGVKIILINKIDLVFLGKYMSAVNLYKILKKDKPDIMAFSGTLPFFLAGKLTGIPIIRIYMGTQFDAFLENIVPGEKANMAEKVINFISNIYIYLVEFLTFHLSAGVVSISKYSKEEGQNLYKRRVNTIIYLGTTLLSKKRQRFNRNKNTVDLISVSRITPYKGFHLIMEALEKVLTEKRIVLNIVGSQPKAKYLKYLKNLSGNFLEIHLNLDDQELAKLYAKSDIYVSADKYLYFGLPILEAASFKLPSISYNLGAASEIVVHKKTGYVANNQVEFIKYLKKLIKNSALRRKMGQNAAYMAKNYFSWNNCAKQYHQFFLKFLKNR